MFDKIIVKNYNRRRSSRRSKKSKILEAIIAFLFFIGLSVLIDDLVHHRPIFHHANTPYWYYRH